MLILCQKIIISQNYSLFHKTKNFMPQHFVPERFPLRSEDKYKLLEELLCQIDRRDLKLLNAPPDLCLILSYSPQELLQKYLYEICHHDDIAYFLSVEEQKTSNFYVRLIRKNGTACFINCHTLMLQQTLFVNFTEHQLSYHLDIYNEAFQVLLEHKQDVVVFWNIEQKPEFISPNSIEVLGYTQQGFILEFSMDVFYPYDSNIVVEAFIKSIESPFAVSLDCRMRTLQGQLIWVEQTFKSVKNQEGKILGVLSIIRSIQHRKQTEEKLKHNEKVLQKTAEELQTILDALPDYYIRLNHDEVILDIKPKFVIKGFAPIVGKHLKDCMPILEYQRIKNFFNEKYKAGETTQFEVEYIDKYFELRVSDISPQEIVCIIRDITEEVVNRRQIELSERKFRSIFFHAPNGIAQLTPTFKFIQVNPALCNLFQVTEEEILKTTLFDWIEDPQNIFIDLIQQFLHSNKPITIDLPIQTQKGTLFVNIKINTVANEIGLTQSVMAHFVDITDGYQQKLQIERNLTEKESLIKEIHHRVKNNLQVISSLISLQLSHIQNKDTLEVFKITQNRVKSIALLHEQLYKSQNFNQVLMNEYIQTLIHNLIFSLGKPKNLVKYSLAMEPFVIDIEIASPLAIVLNELISNAILHAKPKSDPLTIRICYKNIDGKHQMIIQDDGTGIPEPIDFKKVKTLGINLVNILVKQINAQLLYRFEEGATFELQF